MAFLTPLPSKVINITKVKSDHKIAIVLISFILNSQEVFSPAAIKARERLQIPHQNDSKRTLAS